MPSITINGQAHDFEPGETILQIALRNEVEIPHYCYHPGLSIAANCRICLAEVWAPNPRNEGKLEPWPKLVPTCQQTASEGMVIHTDSPKSVANQKQVMELLLINHPVDCPVCDQAGECHLQDYSYQYGRGESRFREDKNKQPKKSIGPNVLLYSDRCIMCTRCVRFTREVTGTGELMVDGRGSTGQIDVFPGMALDNELASNVIDLCPVGALLDKDFLFKQRVWFLTKTPSIDGITSSGDNIWVEHNEGTVHRIKPRENPDLNDWWITDEVRYGWKFVHDEGRLRLPAVRGRDPFDPTRAGDAWRESLAAANEVLETGVRDGRIGLLVSPMLSCEDAYLLAQWVRSIDADVVFGIGPVPIDGEDRSYGEYVVRAEKAPNARGVRRVLTGLLGGEAGGILEADAFLAEAKAGRFSATVITGNYASDWVTPEWADAVAAKPYVLIDTLPSRLVDAASVLLPGATWMEKAGSFQNADDRLQAFERSISTIDYCKGEAQIGIDLLAAHEGRAPVKFDPEQTRAEISTLPGLSGFRGEIVRPEAKVSLDSDMLTVDL
ncbi:MAG: 2Fe-2S iron-sulfur cluster binding domain-containing protein [Phycisphaeraceae bacterium]|nr:2Fe-2S iron-sulfur cluster binding domain-containing protein [Phycisphaeraceae bacterium]MCP4012401.1 2Fe-2S iron-sulfur cluster binding domain-containing protein [Phycisphaeraceae bacterium]MCP4069421.1 2Fe-2S iron-sulfur cluster binding domain-containing protein [Phycisphaeraceae bacterium]